MAGLVAPTFLVTAGVLLVTTWLQIFSHRQDVNFHAQKAGILLLSLIPLLAGLAPKLMPRLLLYRSRLSFADIDDAWKAGRARLLEQQIPFNSVPIYLVIGAISHDQVDRN